MKALENDLNVFCVYVHFGEISMVCMALQYLINTEFLGRLI